MYEYNATVENVVDGDTVNLAIDLGFKVVYRHSCRLFGINAPEHDTPEGADAKAFLQNLLPAGTQVRVKTEKDKAEKYGRILGTLYLLVGKSAAMPSVNERLINEGHAKPWDGKGVRPV